MSQTLLRAWEGTVQAAPDAVAIVDAATGRCITRGELDFSAKQWCDAHGAGLAKQSVVVAEPNGMAWFRVFLGLLEADAIVVPMDPGEPVASQIATATKLRAHAVATAGELRLLAGGRRIRDPRRLVKLTSGSTGVPRAIAFTDGQMLADAAQICAGMDIRPDDVNLGVIPFGHSYGLGNLVVPLIAQGTAIVCGVETFPHAMAKAIARCRPTVFPTVPALLRALTVADVPPADLASLRTVISAGAVLAPEIASTFEAKFQLRIHSFYGSSETGGITYDKTGDAARTGRSVGVPLPDVRLSFARGGRFTVESPAVFTLGNRQRGPSGCGVHRPADIGALTAAGELVLLGRAGRCVKIAGRRLNLVEVERALKKLPGVRDAWVAPHGGREDALAAAVAADVSADQIRTALRERLATWKIPKSIVVLPAFPLTARGKTDTRKLQALLTAK